jgi:hypothetical protein
VDANALSVRCPTARPAQWPSEACWPNTLRMRCVVAATFGAWSSLLAVFGTSALTDIDQANDLGDLDTADLFTELSRGIDKWL